MVQWTKRSWLFYRLDFIQSLLDNCYQCGMCKLTPFLHHLCQLLVVSDRKRSSRLTQYLMVDTIIHDVSTLLYTCVMGASLMRPLVNTLRPRQNGLHFPDDIFKCIFLNENERISIKISLKFVPKIPINNIPALVQIMAWRRPGDKPLSEPMTVSLLTHICVNRPQWVNCTQSTYMILKPYTTMNHP